MTEEERVATRKIVETAFSQSAGEILALAVEEVPEEFKEWAKEHIDWQIVVLPE